MLARPQTDQPPERTFSTPISSTSSIWRVSHTDIGQATVDAPADEVFAALTDAEARIVWLPPAGMSATFDWFDARPGGGYRMR